MGMINFGLSLDNLRKNPAGYLPEKSFVAVVSFLLGYDASCQGGLLLGFHEWLVVRQNFGDNLHWSATVLFLSFPAAESLDDARMKSREEPDIAIGTLFDLISEFSGIRQKRNGLQEIFSQHKKWMDGRRRQAPKKSTKQ